MKKYLLTFICILGFSTLVSTFYVLISHSAPSTSTDKNIIHQNNLQETPYLNDFTQDELETADPEIIEEPLAFIMPVDSNEIGMKFSNGQLVYSKTLGEWIMHNGIDIIAKQGTPVLASEAGKIIEITSNTQEGIKIVIEHKDGYKTVYSNLSTTKMVQEGQTIEKGQAISGVGKTATFEYEEKDHLHFEMYKDGKAINPLNLY
ncbi:MAG: M23 family metallopeptidase [Clostridiales bacterium]|nr:M23 family metallopeptidase [Clostridiales bacterium]